MQKPQDLNDLFREVEEEAYNRTQIELAKEKAEWEALPQAEKDRILAEKQAYWDSLPEPSEEEEEEEEEDDEGEDEDEDE